MLQCQVVLPHLSHPFSATTPAGVGIKNPVRMKWRKTLTSQEEYAGRVYTMGQLVTKVLVSRESPLPPCQLWPGHNSPVPRRSEPGPDDTRQVSAPVRGPRLDECCENPPKNNWQRLVRTNPIPVERGGSVQFNSHLLLV